MATARPRSLTLYLRSLRGKLDVAKATDILKSVTGVGVVGVGSDGVAEISGTFLISDVLESISLGGYAVEVAGGWVFGVKGMMCNGCRMFVEKELRKVGDTDGVEVDVEVSLEKGMAVVVEKVGKVAEKDIEDAMDRLEAKGKKAMRRNGGVGLVLEIGLGLDLSRARGTGIMVAALEGLDGVGQVEVIEPDVNSNRYTNEVGREPVVVRVGGSFDFGKAVEQVAKLGCTVRLFGEGAAPPERKVVFVVQGMTCGNCVRHVKEALEQVEGVISAEVSLKDELAVVKGDFSKDQAMEAVRKLNKVIHVRKDAPPGSESLVTFDVGGMTCRNCVRSVTEALESVRGVTSAAVSLEDKSAIVKGNFSTEEAIEAVMKLDKTISVREDSAPAVESVVTFDVGGMTCENCVRHVREALEKVEGVRAATVSLETNSAVVEGTFNAEEAIEAVKKLNKTIVMRGDSVASTEGVVTFDIGGMTCGNCVRHVKEALEKVEGVRNAAVSLDDKSAVVKGIFNMDEAIEAVKKLNKTISLRGESVPDIERVVTFDVGGMTCKNCVKHVTEALEKVEGVISALVSLEDKSAVVTGNFDIDEAMGVVRKLNKSISVRRKEAEGDIFEVGDGISTEESDTKSEDPATRVSATDSSAGESHPDLASVPTTQLKVMGMTCSACVGAVQDILLSVPGVKSARVNLLAGRAAVVHALDLNVDDLVRAVSAGGYTSSVISSVRDKHGESGFVLEFTSEGAAREALRALNDLQIGAERPELRQNLCLIEVSGRGTTVTDVLRVLESKMHAEKFAVRKKDYGNPESAKSDNGEEEVFMWRKYFAVSFTFLIPLLVLGFIAGRLAGLSKGVVRWIQFLFASLIQFVCGRRFYRNSFHALRRRRATMDVLIALSTTIAYAASAVALGLATVDGTFGIPESRALGHAPMFHVSSMIITVVLLGKYLESRAKQNAAAGVAALSKLQPEVATLYDPIHKSTFASTVPVDVLAVGDCISVSPGMKIAVDGDVVDGESTVNESMLTGESRPVQKSRFDSVYGGTVNLNGNLIVRATHLGADAVLSQIAKLVNDAQTSRAPIEAYADKISAIFVPSIVFLSFCVFDIWFILAVAKIIPGAWYESEGPFFFALLFALETMVIACPCALGLATPTAVMVASEVGTKFGCLFRGGGSALEAAEHVTTVLFDKTGTLTTGQPKVAAVVVPEKSKPDFSWVADLVRATEARSTHPVAAAIVTYLDQSPAGAQHQVKHLEEFPGRGISALVSGHNVVVGSRDWVFGTEANADGAQQRAIGGFEPDIFSDNDRRQIDGLEAAGMTVVIATIGGAAGIAFGIEDEVRPEAHEVVRYISKSLGLQVGLVTGDSVEAAKVVAEKAGISPANVYAKCMPWTKTEIVASSGKVCFVGDGINDAPALAAASVGIAIGAGAPAAAESAAVVIVRDDLTGVINTLRVAKTAFRRVRLNFCWALLYNVLGIPIAAGALYPFLHVRLPPVVASGAMALSSTCVVLSSLSLRMYKPPKLDGESGIAGSTENDVEMGSVDTKKTYYKLVDEDDEDGDISYHDEREPAGSNSGTSVMEPLMQSGW